MESERLAWTEVVGGEKIPADVKETHPYDSFFPVYRATERHPTRTRR